MLAAFSSNCYVTGKDQLLYRSPKYVIPNSVQPVSPINSSAVMVAICEHTRDPRA